MTRRILCSVLLGWCLLTLPGCLVVNQQMLSKVRGYFPAAIIIRPRAELVHIETHVGNISAQFADKTFSAMYDQNGRDLQMAMTLADYKVLVLGFDQFNVVWVPSQGRQWYIMNSPQYTMWYHNTFRSLMRDDYSKAQVLR